MLDSDSDPLPQSGLNLAARRDTLIVDGETKGRHGWYVVVLVVLLFCDLYWETERLRYWEWQWLTVLRDSYPAPHQAGNAGSRLDKIPLPVSDAVIVGQNFWCPQSSLSLCHLPLSPHLIDLIWWVLVSLLNTERKLRAAGKQCWYETWYTNIARIFLTLRLGGANIFTKIRADHDWQARGLFSNWLENNQ